MKPPRAYFPGLHVVIALVLARGDLGQVAPPPDLDGLVRQMGDRVRRLGEDAADLGQTPEGKHMIGDAQELSQALGEFQQTLRATPDPFQRRRAFAGVEAAWQHLRGRLARASSPAAARHAEQVEQLDARIRQAIGMNPPPDGFYGGARAPDGVADTRRLAHALVDRAEALSAAVQADMGRDPDAAPLARDAAELARLADRFHDAIDPNQPVAVASQAFGPVDAVADGVERFITTSRVPPRVQDAWQAFAQVEVLIHRNLGLNSPQPRVQIQVAPPPPPPPQPQPAVVVAESPIVGLANQLVDQVNQFVQVFGPTAGVVPEGGAILADAQRLQAEAADFRQDSARNLPPNQVAHEFLDVDATWQRIARRVNRIARGRTGPNIQQVQRIGATCEQIHRALGMPGYPPALDSPAFR